MNAENYNLPPKQQDYIDEMIDRARADVPEKLNDEQLEAMAAIDSEAIKNSSTRVDTVDVVGVLRGIKPGSLIEDANNMEDYVRKLGLSCEKIEGKGMMTIAWNDELAKYLADDLSASWGEILNETPEGNRKIGKLLGYPETATEYYIDRLASFEDPSREDLPMILPEEFDGTVREYFHQFVLSPDNWREETENYIIPLEEATRELAPRSYKQIEQEVERARDNPE